VRVRIDAHFHVRRPGQRQACADPVEVVFDGRRSTPGRKPNPDARPAAPPLLPTRAADRGAGPRAGGGNAGAAAGGPLAWLST
jgi:hypothetical protein